MCVHAREKERVCVKERERERKEGLAKERNERNTERVKMASIDVTERGDERVRVRKKKREREAKVERAIEKARTSCTT